MVRKIFSAALSFIKVRKLCLKYKMFPSKFCQVSDNQFQRMLKFIDWDI